MNASYLLRIVAGLFLILVLPVGSYGQDKDIRFKIAEETYKANRPLMDSLKQYDNEQNLKTAIIVGIVAFCALMFIGALVKAEAKKAVSSSSAQSFYSEPTPPPIIVHRPRFKT